MINRTPYDKETLRVLNAAMQRHEVACNEHGTPSPTLIEVRDRIANDLEMAENMERLREDYRWLSEELERFASCLVAPTDRRGGDNKTILHALINNTIGRMQQEGFARRNSL